MTYEPPGNVVANKKKKRKLRRKPGDVIISGDQAFRVIRNVGAGGMAQTYEVENCDSKCRFALKEPHPEFLERTELLWPEARVLGILGHPGIVKCFLLGRSADGVPFFLMELLQGMTVRTALRSIGKFEIHEALNIASQFFLAIDHAHNAGVIHRDMKPDNIFLHNEPGAPPVVKILDFGVLKLDGIATKEGVVVGTPLYASFEQLLGLADIHSKSDVYSCTVVLFETLTGVTPFHKYGCGFSASYTDMLRTLNLEPASLLEYGPFPERLARFMRRGLDRDPDKRPAAGEYALELRTILRELTGQTVNPHWISTREIIAIRAAQRPVPATVFESPTIPDGDLIARMKLVREEHGISTYPSDDGALDEQEDDDEPTPVPHTLRVPRPARRDEPASAPRVDRNATTKTRIENVVKRPPGGRGPNGTAVVSIPRPGPPAPGPNVHFRRAVPPADTERIQISTLVSRGMPSAVSLPVLSADFEPLPAPEKLPSKGHAQLPSKGYLEDNVYIDAENLSIGEIERELEKRRRATLLSRQSGTQILVRQPLPSDSHVRQTSRLPVGTSQAAPPTMPSGTLEPLPRVPQPRAERPILPGRIHMDTVLKIGSVVVIILGILYLFVHYFMQHHASRTAASLAPTVTSSAPPPVPPTAQAQQPPKTPTVASPGTRPPPPATPVPSPPPSDSADHAPNEQLIEDYP